MNGSKISPIANPIPLPKFAARPTDIIIMTIKLNKGINSRSSHQPDLLAIFSKI